MQQLLSPTITDAFDRPVCLPETRTQIRTKIIEWVFSDTKQNIFWLHGVAGSGKSTVATTVAGYFRELSRLGCFIFFERGKSDPSSVIRTVAYRLALFDSSIGSSILSRIETTEDIATAPAADQFKLLLAGPLHESAAFLTGPVVIILDGLDECGTSETRKSLMKLFRKDFGDLPNSFRFLVTSRREPDIDQALLSQMESVYMVGLDHTSSASERDVISYLRIGMNAAVREKVRVPDDWPWDRNMELLGRRACGLFIWAATVIKLVSTDDNPFRTLKNLISDSSPLRNSGLDELYFTVLRSSGIAWTNAASRQRFMEVMGLVIFAIGPLPVETIDGLLGYPPEETSLLVISKLQSLLTFSQGGFRVFHASFLDFITSPEHADEPWFIDPPSTRHFFTERCFDVMANMLHFNMCHLKSSFVRDNDTPSFAESVRASVPIHLKYACWYWSSHLQTAQYSPDLRDRLANFAYNQVLFWFEVLGFTRSSHHFTGECLKVAGQWVLVSPHADRVVEIVALTVSFL